jgi:hypothetical protein
MYESQDIHSLISAREDHAKALLDEARRERLVRSGRSGQGKAGLHCWALACLGRWLVALCYGLQRRYNAVALVPQATRASANR